MQKKFNKYIRANAYFDSLRKCDYSENVIKKASHNAKL